MATAKRPTFKPSACAEPRDAALAPLIAGAHARGLFDAFDMIGQGAIFLDRQGRALAVTAAAARALGPTLALSRGRPVAAAADDDMRLQRAILDSLHGAVGALEIGTCGVEMSLRLTPIPADPNQLLAAILLVDPPARRLETPQTSRLRVRAGVSAAH